MKRRVGTHSSRSPCGDGPRSQVHLVDKAVNQRQRLCFKLLAAEKKVPPLVVGCTNETGDGGKGPEGIQCFGVLVISHYSGKYPMNCGCFKENCL